VAKQPASNRLGRQLKTRREELARKMASDQLKTRANATDQTIVSVDNCEKAVENSQGLGKSIRNPVATKMSD
jgi:acyl-CoA reductase-like NAD-dependent aldehyde dehydrogenase